MTSLWDEIGTRAGEDRIETLIRQAKSAVADQTAFLLTASSQAEYEDRLSLVQDDMTRTIAAIAPSASDFPLVAGQVYSHLSDDFAEAMQAREAAQREQAQRVAEQRRVAHRIGLARRRVAASRRTAATGELRITADEVNDIIQSGSGRQYYAETDQGGSYPIYGAFPDGTLAARSGVGGQLARVVRTGQTDRGETVRVMIQFAEDTGDQAGTLLFSPSNSTRGFSSRAVWGTFGSRRVANGPYLSAVNRIFGGGWRQISGSNHGGGSYFFVKQDDQFGEGWSLHLMSSSDGMWQASLSHGDDPDFEHEIEDPDAYGHNSAEDALTALKGAVDQRGGLPEIAARRRTASDTYEDYRNSEFVRELLADGMAPMSKDQWEQAKANADDMASRHGSHKTAGRGLADHLYDEHGASASVFSRDEATLRSIHDALHGGPPAHAHEGSRGPRTANNWNVSYSCNDCRAEWVRDPSSSSENVCPRCGSSNASDRGITSTPATVARRTAAIQWGSTPTPAQVRKLVDRAKAGGYGLTEEGAHDLILLSGGWAEAEMVMGLQAEKALNQRWGDDDDPQLTEDWGVSTLIETTDVGSLEYHYNKPTPEQLRDMAEKAKKPDNKRRLLNLAEGRPSYKDASRASERRASTTCPGCGSDDCDYLDYGIARCPVTGAENTTIENPNPNSPISGRLPRGSERRASFKGYFDPFA